MSAPYPKFRIMETQHQIDNLESRQLELRAIMAQSDDRAIKCFKQGISFEHTYPEDYAQYEVANAEYNKNKQTLARLKAKRAEERAAEEEQRLKNGE